MNVNSLIGIGLHLDIRRLIGVSRVEVEHVVPPSVVTLAVEPWYLTLA